MHLKKILLPDFRCFKRLELELHPRLTVLVADNGGGKTAVLEGIAKGLGMWIPYFDSADQRLTAPEMDDNDHRVTMIKQKSGRTIPRRAKDVAIVLEADDELRWTSYHNAFSKGLDQQVIAQEVANHFGRTNKEFAERATGLRDKVYSDSTEKTEIPVFAYYGVSRGQLDIPERKRRSTVDYSHRFAGLLDALNPEVDFKELLKWLREEIGDLAAQKELANLLDDEPTSESAMVHVSAAVESVLGENISHPHFSKSRRFSVFFKKSDGKKVQLEIEELSQGYQTMLALTMDFARRLAVANPFYWTEHTVRESADRPGAGEPLKAPAIMLVDEIDLHLHPSWQQRVLPDLMRAFPGTQFIVTTHSPQVLSTVPKECIRILSCDSDGLGSAIIPSEQTKGVESATVLAEVMHVDPLPKVDEVTKLSRYRALIQQALETSDEAERLRTELNAHYGESSQVMLECERIKRLEVFKRTLPPRSSTQNS
jgi:predicted ATP-binding protein involved in virulence